MPEEHDGQGTQGNMIRLGGLWQNKSRKGEMYLSGTFTPGVSMLVFKNNHKKDDKHPDYILFLAPKEEKDKPRKQDDAGSDGAFM